MYYANGTFDGYGNMPSSNFYQSAYMQQNPNYQMPMNQNALTREEIQTLTSSRPTGQLNLEISKEDVLRSYCCHCDNGKDLVVQCNDGSGDVFCPICGERWNVNSDYSKEDVEKLVKELLALMQTAKWAGNIPVEVIRKYFSMIPLLEKFPDIYDYANKNLKRIWGQNPFKDANDGNVFAQYNSLFAGNQFGAPQYYNNNINPYMNAQPMNYYSNQIPVQNPGYNPMQVNNNQAGYYPYNPQFNQQAANMMPGYQAMPNQPINAPQNPYANNQMVVPQNNNQPQQNNQQPSNQVVGYTPVYGVPQQQQNGQTQPKEESSSAIYQL